MSTIEASIIIPTKDKISRLLLVLKVLESQISKKVEVIVVFDGCMLETLNEFKKYNFNMNLIQVNCETNVGRAAARNKGIRIARGKTIIFIDDDRIPGPDFVSQHLLHRINDQVVLGKRLTIELTENEIVELYKLSIVEIYEKIIKISYIDPQDNIANTFLGHFFSPKSRFRWMRFITGNVSVPHNSLLNAGCFDENYQGWGQEDRDLGYRLSRLGLTFMERDIVNYHIFHKHDTRMKYKESMRNLRYMISKIKNDIGSKSILLLVYAHLWIKSMIFQYIPGNNNQN